MDDFIKCCANVQILLFFSWALNWSARFVSSAEISISFAREAFSWGGGGGVLIVILSWTVDLYHHHRRHHHHYYYYLIPAIACCTVPRGKLFCFEGPSMWSAITHLFRTPTVIFSSSFQLGLSYFTDFLLGLMKKGTIVLGSGRNIMWSLMLSGFSWSFEIPPLKDLLGSLDKNRFLKGRNYCCSILFF